MSIKFQDKNTPEKIPATRKLNFNVSAQQIINQFNNASLPLFCTANNSVFSFFDAELAEFFFSEKCIEGTIQAKIGPNIYIIRVQDSFIKMYSDNNIPLGTVLK